MRTFSQHVTLFEREKVVVLDASGQVVHKVYRRHKADFNETLLQELKTVRSLFQKEGSTRFTI